jgi:hypothetical protein
MYAEAGAQIITLDVDRDELHRRGELQGAQCP